ncbi:hypothetical protein DFR24_3644 [Panacagrimonas perspica]|uniref:Lipoprotein n=1 Tax=Panacagrimonas perspica TaxID=381431 RepID=A0A4R7NZ40_9GAMM|nr:hypothetical protein [Panacagrimonas perspica]TDU26615.1 hypothetical protein DFR24_3644 [Panacagrimonas perspica]
MKRRVILIACAMALSSCAQITVNHYLPSGAGELRNRSLCTLGLRDELEVPLGPSIKVRVWGGDPDTTSLSARVQFLVPEGQTMRLTSNRFLLFTKAAAEPAELFTTGITTACPAGVASCRTRLAPTDWLEGGLMPAANVLVAPEPKTYRMDVAVPVPPGETYTLKLPDVELTGRVVPGPTVRFDKTAATAATNLGVCQG